MTEKMKPLEITDEMVTEMRERVLAALERLSIFGDALPKPYEFYRAIKNNGEGTGWAYHAIGLGELDLKTLAEILTAWNTRSPPPIASAGGEERPAAYQQMKDGEWKQCSEFVAKGWANELSPGVRALYLHPARPLSSDTGDVAVEYARGWKEAVDACANASLRACGCHDAIRALPIPTAPSISKRSV